MKLATAFPEGRESSGIQIATGNSLTFDKVPADILYGFATTPPKSRKAIHFEK